MEGTQRGGAREGAGRPQKYGGKTRHISINLPVELIEHLSQIARKNKISRSHLFTSLITTSIQQGDCSKTQC